ncbi:DNA polymerase III subunit gamma/tau [Peptoniphilus sp. MSJ-1]|uniref:DNA-directed DNA polymerase n=1 Tax=Peptoniphilus ovalis TaxID=2841503 RepID=A0ABS6FIU0_9FIRM|nr:DNA polymerase III subunit gamma/tau [Peptoniphilus ovalis]MBU5669358.1 DNA polymerase III subunit gamma/tau [Peptoniphilus ovalis]
MYKALYRKYRSKTFDEMCGQEAVVASLKNQVKNNEISHAYIFSGTRGTGKTSAAKIFSRAVNCLNPKDGNPCNECENCKKILNESVLDVVEMDAASNNGVDDIRELKEKVVYPPTSLKYKVYIIDEVHMLSKGAFNALLKILEEPPRHLIFILATTELEKIPATILSRSQKFFFKRIPSDVIENHLKEITKLEGKSCDDDVYSLIAKSSDGAMRDALSVLDQLLTLDKNHIETKDAMEILGISSSDLLFELSEALIARDINKSLNTIDEIFREGVDFTTLTSQILNHFRDLILVKTLKNPEKIVFSTYIKDFSSLAGRSDLEDLIVIVDLLKEITNEIKYADNKRIIFEMNCIKICNRNNGDDILGKIKNLEDKINNIGTENLVTKKVYPVVNEIPVNNKINDTLNIEHEVEARPIENSLQSDIIKEVSTKESNEVSKENLDLNKIKNDFPKIIDELKSKKEIGLAGIIEKADIENFSNGTLVFNFSKENSFYYEVFNKKENIDKISDELKLIYGRDIEVRVKNGDSSFSIDKKPDKLEEIFGKENIIDI